MLVRRLREREDEAATQREAGNAAGNDVGLTQAVLVQKYLEHEVARCAAGLAWAQHGTARHSNGGGLTQAVLVKKYPQPHSQGGSRRCRAGCTAWLAVRSAAWHAGGRSQAVLVQE